MARKTFQTTVAWDAPNVPERPTSITPVVIGPIRTGTTVPLFGADRWNLACIFDPINGSTPTLVFNFSNSYFKQVAKELIWQRLNTPVASLRKPGAQSSWSARTCTYNLGYLRKFFGFLTDAGIKHLSEVTESDVEDFRARVMATEIGTLGQANILKIVDRLYESREHLTGGGLTFVPWPDVATTRLVGFEFKGENQTPRIPESILGPLLGWALAYVEHFSAEIIAADRFQREWIGTQLLRSRAHDALAEYISLEVVSRGVPAQRRYPNKLLVEPCWQMIARRAGVSLHWLNSTGRSQLSAAVETYGLDEFYLPQPAFRFEGTSTPWRDGMRFADMVQECVHLTTACYIVCAYLSGMRDGEVQSLKRDCLKILRDADGRPFRWKVEGLTFKNEPTPKTVTWVVIEPVARAIQVLKELTEPLSIDVLEKSLFVRTHSPNRQNNLLKNKINPDLNGFVRHCNVVLAPRLTAGSGRVPTGFGGHAKTYDIRAIPDDGDAPWNFTTRQFRRTLAWHIGNRPMGVVAGMIQYKHASIQMFEGYAGTSKSEFKAEIAQEEASAKRDDIISRYEEYSTGVLPAGPMARELKALFAHIAKEAGPTPLKVVDNKRVEKLVDNLASRLYPGVLADCFYVPSRARCQMTTETDLREAPVPALCDPECSSACWTHKHLDAWNELRAETSALRSKNRVSPEQRAVFDGMVERIDRRVAAIEEAQRGKTQD